MGGLLLSDRKERGSGSGERGGGEEPGGADREEIVFGISCVREESIFDFKKLKMNIQLFLRH